MRLRSPGLEPSTLKHGRLMEAKFYLLFTIKLVIHSGHSQTDRMWREQVRV